MDVFTQQVIKEPKGFIRIIQFVFAFLAMYTTSSFSTFTSFVITCYNKNPVTIKYEVEYPFDFQDQEIFANRSCEKDTVGVLSILYAAGALVTYSYGIQRYRENALLPVLDLIGTTIMSIFWLAGSTAWSAGVSDVKYYVNPEILKEHLAICKEGGKEVCSTTTIGKWAGLNISVIFGFGCVLVWCASIWFVYKETQFFKQQQQQRELLQQQQFGGQPGVQSMVPGAAPAGPNPFGNYDPIGQQTAAQVAQPNPYIQQPAQPTQYSSY